MIGTLDLRRYHSAARLIEDEGMEVYWTCRERYGADAAGMLIVMWLRSKLNTEPNQWPPPDDLIDKVNEALRSKGILQGNEFA